jgi:hypothetical protein
MLLLYRVMVLINIFYFFVWILWPQFGNLIVTLCKTVFLRRYREYGLPGYDAM